MKTLAIITIWLIVLTQLCVGLTIIFPALDEPLTIVCGVLGLSAALIIFGVGTWKITKYL